MKYTNPVIPGFNPDPSICCVGEDYYLVTSSFEFYPGVPIYHSRNLINWEMIGYCLTRPSQLDLKNSNVSSGIWAPTIRYHNERFYMTTTNMNSPLKNFYVTAEDPAGPWSEPIWVDMGGIDPSIFFDEDGKAYYTTNAGLDGKKSIVMAEVDIETGKLISPVRYIWGGTGGLAPEGAHLYKNNDIYYLMIAEGGTHYGHMETIARSRSIWGPYESYNKNPILTHRNMVHPIQGTGHADLVQAPDGRWWMVFLAFRTTGGMYHHLGRETFLAPVTWSDEGWPVVYKNGTVDLEMDVQGLSAQQNINSTIFDDFDNEKLSLYWNFIRNPYESSWSLFKRRGWLSLQGSELTLDCQDSPAFIGLRQQHFECCVTALMEFNIEKNGEEAGLTVFRNRFGHYDIALTMIDSGRYVIIRRKMVDLSVIVVKEPVSIDKVVFSIRADRSNYEFGYGKDKESIKYLCKARVQFLAGEACHGPFTGVYFGMYAAGSGAECTCPAYFDWFEYRA